MRNLLLLAPVSLLAACGGGGGAQSVGSNAAPPAPVGTPTPGQTGSGHSFVVPTEAKTYSAIGGVHKFNYYTTNQDASPVTGFQPGTQRGQLYSGDVSTARNSDITVTYNPRDAIFEVKVIAPLAAVSQTLRFQDPAHRTNFGGATQPQGGVPQFTSAAVQYLEAGSSSGPLRFDPAQSTTFPIGDSTASRNISTFFYQKPGTETKYVTFAGFVRNSTAVVEMQDNNGPVYLRQNHQLERAAFTFGERTDNAAVPRTGTGTFTGPMIATMVYNPLFDIDPNAPTYFQWIDGRATTTVDFAASSFSFGVTGTVFAPEFDIYTDRSVFTNSPLTVKGGASFAAAGSGRIDLVGAGGFLGQMSSASFTQGGQTLAVNVLGSSVDGAFFGPAAEEVGGAFRIVGGTPDTRIDILGTYTGKK